MKPTFYCWQLIRINIGRKVVLWRLLGTILLPKNVFLSSNFFGNDFSWLLPLSHIHTTIHYLNVVSLPLCLPPPLSFSASPSLLVLPLSLPHLSPLSLMQIARNATSQLCLLCMSNCARAFCLTAFLFIVVAFTSLPFERLAYFVCEIKTF